MDRLVGLSVGVGVVAEQVPSATIATISSPNKDHHQTKTSFEMDDYMLTIAILERNFAVESSKAMLSDSESRHHQIRYYYQMDDRHQN